MPALTAAACHAHDNVKIEIVSSHTCRNEPLLPIPKSQISVQPLSPAIERTVLCHSCGIPRAQAERLDLSKTTGLLRKRAVLFIAYAQLPVAVGTPQHKTPVLQKCRAVLILAVDFDHIGEDLFSIHSARHQRSIVVLPTAAAAAAAHLSKVMG